MVIKKNEAPWYIYTDMEILPDVLLMGKKKQNIERYIIIYVQRAKYMYMKLKYTEEAHTIVYMKLI